MTEPLTAYQQQMIDLASAGVAIVATVGVLVAIAAGAAFVRGLW